MIKGRFFLIGCARSGTTLLQSMLASHPDLCSFPETNYVNVVIGDGRRRTMGISPDEFREKAWLILARIRIAFGIANRSAIPKFARAMQDIGRPDLARLVSKHPVWIDRCVEQLSKALDFAAGDQGYGYWLEKSPFHYGYVEDIATVIKEAKFIHIIRGGCDVVASLYDASQKYPLTWGKNFTDVNSCVQCWNTAVRTSRRYIANPYHLIVFYDDLVTNPTCVLGCICRFLGLSYDSRMLIDYANTSDKLIVEHEKWKKGVKGKLQSKSKFQKLFSQQERDYICANLENIADLREHYGMTTCESA